MAVPTSIFEFSVHKYMAVADVVQNFKKSNKVHLASRDTLAKMKCFSLNSVFMKRPDPVVSFSTVLYGFRVPRVVLSEATYRRSFTVRNWLSNSSGGLRRFGAEVTRHTTRQTERVLGMLWAPKPDIFIYVTTSDLSTITPNKRNILRCIMNQYVPLGLLSHFFVHGCVIIQNIWRTKAGYGNIVGAMEMIDRSSRESSERAHCAFSEHIFPVRLQRKSRILGDTYFKLLSLSITRRFKWTDCVITQRRRFPRPSLRTRPNRPGHQGFSNSSLQGRLFALITSSKPLYSIF